MPKKKPNENEYDNCYNADVNCDRRGYPKIGENGVIISLNCKYFTPKECPSERREKLIERMKEDDSK